MAKCRTTTCVAELHTQDASGSGVSAASAEAVREVAMQNLFQLGMRDANGPSVAIRMRMVELAFKLRVQTPFGKRMRQPAREPNVHKVPVPTGCPGDGGRLPLKSMPAYTRPACPSPMAVATRNVRQNLRATGTWLLEVALPLSPNHRMCAEAERPVQAAANRHRDRRRASQCCRHSRRASCRPFGRTACAYVHRRREMR